MRALALAALLCATAFAEGSNYRQKAQEAVSRLDVQRALPEDSTVTDAPKSHGAEMSGSDFEIDGVAPPLSMVWDKFKWVALAAIGVAIAGFLANRFLERVRDAQPVAPSVPPASSDADASPISESQLLSEADRYSGEGRYRDAMHCVLLAAMAHVARRFRDGPRDSATSWELLRSAELKPFERNALRDLVMRTDRAWFGEHASNVEDYQGARRCLQTFLADGEMA